MAPLRMAAKYGHHFWTNSANPVADTELGRSYTASLEMFERLTRRYGKPEFCIASTTVDGKTYAVHENVVRTVVLQQLDLFVLCRRLMSHQLVSICD